MKQLPSPTLVAEGIAFPESARWHDGRLWFAKWSSGEVAAVAADGSLETHAAGPDGYGWSIDWLPDGSLLTTGPTLTRTRSDRTRSEYGSLRTLGSHGWNELVVSSGGDVYVNGLEFDLANGGAPQPGIIALVRADGSTVQVADGIRFPNGMVIADGGRTLVVAESFANCLTAWDILPDGTLSGRREWAGGVAPDGICVDSEGAIWTGAPDIRMMTGDAASPGGALIRVLEGGEVTDRIELDRPAFSCVLGGDEGRTLYLLAREWDGFDKIDETSARLTGRILAVEVDVPAAR